MIDSYDFGGWATKNDLLCADGRVIRKDAFKECDGRTVPLVWNHNHNDPTNVLGHALLENRPEGVYLYGVFNGTSTGQHAKQSVQHGDVNAVSIYANRLQESGRDVLHGVIREVSLVLAGANPGAKIETVFSHSDEMDDEAIIYSGEAIELKHAEEEKPEAQEGGGDSEKTVRDVWNTMNEEQQTVVAAMIATLMEDGVDESADETENENEEDSDVKHNVFDQNSEEKVLKHSEDEINQAIKDASRHGSMKESFLAHGITNVDYLFPDAKNVNNPPAFYRREDSWVSRVMNGVHHTPFSRVKSMYADLTADEARAKGYVKGKQKVEEVIVALKRSTTPQTVYKLQKMDRDDIIDITDFNVVNWLKSEMRIMLNEELARAFLVGDGRLASSDDKIKEDNIRPIWTDDEVYTIHSQIAAATLTTADQRAKAFIRACVKSRKDYKGSGNPVLFTTEDMLTDCLLMEDTTGRVIYDTVDKLATAIRVSSIITVPVMENLTREVTTNTHELAGIIVNLADYNVGADKGGEVNMFDDFDIDYNKYSYLIETRCSGALIRPKSAIAIEFVTTTPVEGDEEST